MITRNLSEEGRYEQEDVSVTIDRRGKQHIDTYDCSLLTFRVALSRASRPMKPSSVVPGLGGAFSSKVSSSVSELDASKGPSS